MDRIAKLFATAALTMTLLLAVAAPHPTSAIPTGVSPSLLGVTLAESCSPSGAVASLSSIPAAKVIAPAPSAQQEGEEEEDDEGINMECELEGSVKMSVKDGTVHLRACSPQDEDGNHETINCILTTGGNEVGIALTGCVGLSYTPNE